MHMPYPALPAQYMHVQWNVQSASLCIFQNIQQAKESQIAYTLNMKELSLSLSLCLFSLSRAEQHQQPTSSFPCARSTAVRLSPCFLFLSAPHCSKSLTTPSRSLCVAQDSACTVTTTDNTETRSNHCCSKSLTTPSHSLCVACKITTTDNTDTKRENHC